MMLSDLAVRRPVFAAVAAIVLCVIGAAAFFFLPVRELPDVDPPIVSVSTSYAGASAEVIESRITEPIEQQIAGIQGVDRITSSSRDGRSNVSIEFSLDRNIDDAANDVRDRVSRVVGRLPDQAQPPEVSKADSDSQPIMILFLRSSGMNRLELTDYADRYLIDRLATVPGVAQVQIYGEQRYAMRIWLDAAALAARGLTVTDVETALTAQNVELPAGQLESGQKDYTPGRPDICPGGGLPPVADRHPRLGNDRGDPDRCGLVRYGPAQRSHGRDPGPDRLCHPAG